MSDKTETEPLIVTVTEEVQYSRTVEVTTELLDRAQEEGYPRSIEGVGAMLEDNPDDDVVMETVDNVWFVGVFDRFVTAG